MAIKKLSADGILVELDIPNYIQGVNGYETIVQTAQETLKSMESYASDYRLHLDNVHDFMKALWNKYDCSDIVEVFRSLTSIEPALLDLEREPKAANRYRDHYVHLFHVFVFGLRILSAIIRVLGDEQASEILKVRKESLENRLRGHNLAGDECEFHDYHWKERLFYLWTLMATLHDIAIPITHLGGVRKALNSFSEKFHLEISGPLLTPILSPDLNAYSELLSRIFEGVLGRGEESWRYNKRNLNHYVKGYLEKMFRDEDHGVLGGFLMYKKIEEIFLLGKSKCKLDMASFGHYRELVLEEDIARAALAISLHNVEYKEPDQRPHFLPLNFHDYPLTFILMLADGLQEYLRWEGTSIRGGTKIYAQPRLKLTASGNALKLDCYFSIGKAPAEEAYFLQEVKRRSPEVRNTPSENQIAFAADALCRSVENDISKKICLNDRFTLCLHFQHGDKHLLSYTFSSATHFT